MGCESARQLQLSPVAVSVERATLEGAPRSRRALFHLAPLARAANPLLHLSLGDQACSVLAYAGRRATARCGKPRSGPTPHSRLGPTPISHPPTVQKLLVLSSEPARRTSFPMGIRDAWAKACFQKQKSSAALGQSCLSCVSFPFSAVLLLLCLARVPA